MNETLGYGHRNVTRRRMLAGAALGSTGLAAASLIGCGDNRQATAPATNEIKQPKRGGILSRAGGSAGTYDTQGVGLDPHTYLAIAAMGYRLFYQGLLAYDPRTYEIQPQLGAKWEQPSSTEYIFTLQPNVKWHNKPPVEGRTMTIEDVVFSLERARTNDSRFFSRSVLVSVDKIEALDKSRLRITTKGPDATTLSKLSADLLMVLAPEVVEGAGRLVSADAAVGTGAFILKSLEEGVGSEYVRNPDYWKPNLPYLDGIRTVHLKDEQAGYAAFQGGQVNIARVFGTEAKKYIADQGAGYTPDWFFDNTIVFGQPNTKQSPMDDRRVTRALRLVIDHQEEITAWAEVWFGKGSHGSLFPPALHQWDLSIEEYEKYQPWKPGKNEAIREGLSLLTAAGYTKDNPLKFEVLLPTTGQLVAFAQLYQARWHQSGQGVIDAQLKTVDIAVANQLRAQRNFTYLIHGNVPGTSEPDSWLAEIYRSGASSNFMNFSDPKFDEMIDRQRTIFDQARRKAAIKDIILYYIENGPSSIPANRYYLNGLRPKIEGYAPEFYISGDQYERIWIDAG